MFGFLNVYKPKGMTSHDVVSVLRRLTKIRQIGHTGTLDPFAEGVLPICLGKATRLIEYLDDDKEYAAVIKFGAETSTYDLEGEFTKHYDKKITELELKDELENFKGEISQIPPIYSAIKVNGKKLYEYARKGENVEIQPRKVFISKIELLNFDFENQTAEIRIACSKGTYIRSVAHDLGQNLDCGGYLTKLVRTAAGKFTADKSVGLEELKDNPHLIKANLLNPLEVIDLPRIELSPSEHEKIMHGMQIENKTNYVDFVILVYNKNVSAVGRIQDKRILAVKVFDIK